ncbi:MAG: hypothetical protein J6Y95_01475 [Lachnospiraceae bacterium]|nr:hypothetical protein [Lachnospiraceae bacterium]
MDKYTDLEQALRDPSLAIITDAVTTLKELNRVYAKYRVLPRRQKRFSNYYSNEFLGHNVTEMYVLKKDELKADSDFFEDLQLPSDKYVVSEPDLYYKEDSFNSGDTNICFILGHSGSGKSKMARTLEGDDIDHIELDDLLLAKDHFTLDELKDYSDLFCSFFTGEGAKYYIGVEERDSIPKEEYEDKINVYRSFFGDSPYTVFREETNEDAKRAEAMISELNCIDRCFVDGDAEGINEILKKAESDAALSNWDKLRIVKECRAALFDLHL